MRTGEVKALLRKRYQSPEWALMFEVADATGAGQRRYADAVAMNLWPSRGLTIHGFEIKVSRSDWMRELKSPEKSVPVQKYCHHWWVVAPDGVIKDGELPANWGFMRASASKLEIEHPAPTLDNLPVDDLFVASMLRRVSDVDAGEVEKLVSDRVEAIRKNDEQYIEQTIKRRTREIDLQVALLKEIEDATGLNIRNGFFDSPSFAEAVALVHETGVVGTYGLLNRLRKDARQMADRLGELLPPVKSENVAEHQSVCVHKDDL